MMARKLAGMFALLAMITYFGAWLATRYLAGDEVVGMDVEVAWQVGVGVAVTYFLVGLFFATLALGLVQEVLAERRSRETERRFRARQSYEAIIAGDPVDAPRPKRGESRK